MARLVRSALFIVMMLTSGALAAQIAEGTIAFSNKSKPEFR
jgi:hypothetical protein